MFPTLPSTRSRSCGSVPPHFALPGTPKPCLPIWIPVPMSYPVTEKERTASHLSRPRGHPLLAKEKIDESSPLSCRGNLLIRIETENPRLGRFFCRRVFLGNMLLPFFTKNPGPVLQSAIRSVPSVISSFTTTTDVGHPPPNTLESPSDPSRQSGPEIRQTDMGRGAGHRVHFIDNGLKP